MKRIILIFTLIIFIVFGCKKVEKPVVEDEKEEIEQPDISFVKFINPPPGNITMPKYVSVKFFLSYHVSNEVLPISGEAFKIYNSLIIDDENTNILWSSQILGMRTDTVDFTYESKNYMPKKKIRFVSKLIQAKTETSGYVIAKTDTLTYQVQN